MEELKMAQFNNNYTHSKEKTSEILRSVNIDYCIPDKLPGSQEIREWSGYTSLYCAAKELALDLTNELLQKGADPFKQGNKDGCTPLHVAMNTIFSRPQYHYECGERMENCRVLNAILSRQVNINNILNPKNRHGVSHLHIACIVDHAEAVELFARAKEPLDQTINYDSRFVYDTYYHSYLDNSKYIRETEQLQGYTPLHCAVKYSSVKAAEMLLQYGADIHIANGKGMSCVHLLIERKMLMADFITMGKRRLCMPFEEEIEKIESIIKIVLETRASNEVFVDEIGLSALHLVSTLGDKSIVEEFLKREVDVNVRVKSESEFWPGWTPLHFAACFHTDTMILLLKSGADVTIENFKGETALDLCAKRFTPADVQLILSTKEELKNIVLSDNTTKLSDLLLVMNDYDKLKNFLQNLADVNLRLPFNSPIWAGYSLLHLSISLNKKTIKCENTFLVKIPEARKTDVERYNCTEEEEALYCKRIDLCLKSGCSVSMQNAKGQTPVHLAFSMLCETTVKKLLKRSRDNVVDEDNLSHLHIACAVGDLKAVKRYSRKGANLNCRMRTNFDWSEIDYPRTAPMVKIQAGSTPLHVAVAFAHYQIVKFLLQSNVDVYAKDSLDLTPIHLFIGADWDEQELAQLFFQAIPNLQNSTSKTGLSHLHIAVKAGDLKAVERMLLGGAEVNCAVDANVKQLPFLAYMARKTPLHLCASHYTLGKGGNKIIEVLLKHGANVHAKDLWGISVLQYSINDLEKKWTEPLVKMLKSGMCDIEASGLTLLHFACGIGDIEWVKKLVENGADVNARINADIHLKGATPLYVLFNNYRVVANIDIVKLLLDNGADVTIECSRHSPLSLLVGEIIGSSCEVAKQYADFLFKSHKSYNVNPVGRGGLSYFHLACVRNDIETVQKFLDHGVDVNQSVVPFSYLGGFTPLHFAMARQNTEVVNLLLEKGADVNAEDANGNKPLHAAVWNKVVDLSLIETLLRYGANIHDENTKGVTPFNCYQKILGSAMLSAAPNNFLPILKRLVQVFDVKTVIRSGLNVIHSIVAVGHKGELTLDNYLSSIEYLMSIGCELDQQNTKGKTALQTAWSCHNAEAIGALLQLGANVNVEDFTNRNGYKKTLSRIAELNHIDALGCHIWKMQFAGLTVNHSNGHVKEIAVDSSIEKPCQDELKKAKDTDVIENLTVNDFLSGFKAIRKYTRLGPELRDVVDKFFNCTDDLRREFPEFCGLLAMQYRKACTRRELLQPAKDAILSICPISLPDLCLEAMLEFFTNGEMKMVIASVERLFN